MDQDLQKVSRRIQAIKTEWGNRLCILGHYYQTPAILAHVDVVGDSFKLSKEAAAREGCDAIVFCGVHFMAETADILANAPNRLALRTKPVEVLLANARAGCPMADMATLRGVEAAWNEMAEVIDVDDVAPITYVNSSAAIKAFCGKRGGFSCTSSNADKVLRRALSEKKRVLFIPDEHLGQNTALKFGIPEREILFWSHSNPTMLEKTAFLEQEGFLPVGTVASYAEAAAKPLGGNRPQDLRNAKIILWRGFCPVHQRFLPRDIVRFREDHPNGRIAVHPECRRDVVFAADMAGSTKRLLDLVAKSEPGSVWGIGTERHFVENLINEYKDRDVCFLSPEKPLCSDMSRTTLDDLLRALVSLEEGEPINRVSVDESVAAGARLALERMLECE
ncbi:MAG: quinolinate synthase NadA [Thermoguttaceae bacterium]|jgi:quinolinate synthase